MKTETLLEQVSQYLNRTVRILLQEKYGRVFYPYLILNAPTDLKGLYADAFRIYFRDYSGRLAEKVAFAGMNLAYALKVYMDLNSKATLKDVQNFASKFIDGQLEDYYDWSGDLSTR